MQSTRSAIALDPRSFGRRNVAVAAPQRSPHKSSMSDDLRLFGTTFAGGFLFVSLILA